MQVALPGASAAPCDVPTLVISTEAPQKGHAEGDHVHSHSEEGAAAPAAMEGGAAEEGKAVESSGSVGSARMTAAYAAAAVVSAALAVA